MSHEMHRNTKVIRFQIRASNLGMEHYTSNVCNENESKLNIVSIKEDYERFELFGYIHTKCLIVYKLEFLILYFTKL